MGVGATSMAAATIGLAAAAAAAGVAAAWAAGPAGAGARTAPAPPLAEHAGCVALLLSLCERMQVLECPIA